MNQSIDESRAKLIQDFNAVIGDTEQLLRSLATAGGEKASSLRESAEENLRVARERLEDLKATAAERGRAAAKATDEYVHEHPWQSIAIVGATAALVGFVVGLLLNRR